MPPVQNEQEDSKERDIAAQEDENVEEGSSEDD